MTNKDLANLIFKDLEISHDDLLKKYPERNLDSNAIVTRYAPSPTGFIHMGNIFAAFIERKMARQTGGVFFLRIEDTDQERYIENGIERILKDLKNFNIEFDECPLNETEAIGNYGPYIQSKRIDIYRAFAKYFVEIGRAYPCFCSAEDLTNMRDSQKEVKDRLGYYGKYAKCRHLSIDESYDRIKNGESFVLRFRSNGNFNNKVIVNDLVKGRIEFPENDKDEVILKSTDGLPTYHFAHLVDDTLMKTTHVIRDHNWLPSTPLHLELFDAYGRKAPKYAHISPVNKKDGDSIRKLSKRKDPEAAVSYYHELGIPIDAVMLYIATISNSNFEIWHENNKDKGINDFTFSFNKISKSGPLFDVEKLNSLAKDYISRMSAKEVYDNLLNWANEFDKPFHELITKHSNYTVDLLNIEREQKKPRKDFYCYSEIKSHIWYMYDEMFLNVKYDWQNISDVAQIKSILKDYIENYFDISDTKEEWFNKIKELSLKYNYCPNMKEYNEFEEKYNGSIIDISTMIRVALTSKTITPDLYDIMKLLGKDRIIERIEKIK